MWTTDGRTDIATTIPRRTTAVAEGVKMDKIRQKARGKTVFHRSNALTAEGKLSDRRLEGVSGQGGGGGDAWQHV